MVLASGGAALDSPQAPITESAVGSAIAAAVPFRRKSRRELAWSCRTSSVMVPIQGEWLAMLDESLVPSS